MLARLALRLAILPALITVATLPAFGVGLTNNAALEGLRAEEKASAKNVAVTSGARLLATVVDAAIDDAMTMPLPRDAILLRLRLKILLDDASTFRTTDRELAARYAIRIWRAAGFTSESGLFRLPDEHVLKGSEGP